VRLRMIVAVVVAVMLAGSVGFTQGQGRAIQEKSTATWEGVFVPGCTDDYGNTFDVMNYYEATVRGTKIYNKMGQIAKEIKSYKFTYDVFWNSLDPDKSLHGGPGENEEARWTYENGVRVTQQMSGAIVRINLRGYGPIYAETGHQRLDPNTYEVLFNSGWNSLFSGDAAAAKALCDALK